jgi:hypothetical protein
LPDEGWEGKGGEAVFESHLKKMRDIIFVVSQIIQNYVHQRCSVPNAPKYKIAYFNQKTLHIKKQEN